jgi:hypothetical protein
MHYAASSRMAQRIRSGWLEGEHDEGRSLALARELRTATPGAAQASVVAELNAGRHPAVLWDALRLAAADLFVRSPGLLAVHATTVTNALYHVHRSSRNDEMRRIALLQAAAWITLFRDRFVRSLDTSMKGPGLDAVLEEEEGESAEALAAAHRAHLFRSVDNPHQPKYAAAVLEDARLAHPRWRRALLRPALDYLAGSNTPQTDLCQRSRELIGRLDR